MIDSWHPDDNQCALFLEGALDEAATAEVTRHLATCNDCLAIVGGSAKLLRERAWWQQPAVWAAAAAAVVLVIIGPAVFRQWRDATAINVIAEAAPRIRRPVEPRLTGFPYAPHPNYRGNGQPQTDEEELEKLKLEAAAGKALEKVQNSSSANAAHTAGVAYLVTEQYELAITDLQKAAQRNPNDPHIWSDLGAAQIAAKQYSAALASIDHALKLDPKLLDAQFNRALALDHSRQPQALAAWRAYAANDPNSGWGAEARRQIDLLTSP